MRKAVRAGDALSQHCEQFGKRTAGRIAKVSEHMLHSFILHIAFELRLVVHEKQIPCTARTDDLEAHSARRERFAVGLELLRQIRIDRAVAGNKICRLDAGECR